MEPNDAVEFDETRPRDVKTALSSAVATLGILVGIYFLVFVAPVMLFTKGTNDSWPEILSAALLILSMLPASVLALYNRLWAGVWLTAVGFYDAVASAWNLYFVSAARHLHLGFTEIIGEGFLGWIVIAFGLFFWTTAVLQWPNVKSRKRHSCR